MYIGKYPVIGCLNILKVLNKIAKSGESLDHVIEEQAKYKESPEYKKFIKDHEGEDEEDMPLTDPEGWDLYVEANKKPYHYMEKFATNVALANTTDPQV